MLDAAATVDGGPRPGSIARALSLVEQGRGRELVVAVTRDRREAQDPARDVAETLTAPLAAVAAAQLVDRAGATWRVSWGGPLELVDAGGEVIELHDDLRAALLDPTRLPALRDRWADQGIDLRGQPAEPVVEVPDRVLMVLPDARVDGGRGARVDLLLTRELLVVAPVAAAGRLRAAGRAVSEDRRKLEKAWRGRLPLYRAVPPGELVARPGVASHRWDDLDAVELRGTETTYTVSITVGRHVVHLDLPRRTGAPGGRPGAAGGPRGGRLRVADAQR